MELTQKDYKLMKQLESEGDEHGAYLVSTGEYPKCGGMTGESMICTLNFGVNDEK